MEQLFGARIGARIKQLFGARIRDPKGTAFRGPNRGPNRTTFRGPGLLAVDVSLGALWRPPFQSAHLCPPAIFSGLEWYTTFRGPNPGPEWNSFSEATVSICTFVSTSHLFGARMVYDFSGPESGTRMEQLFGARIGARIEQLFRARGSWLWMFLQGLFGGHRFNLHICVHQPSFRGPNGMTFWGPSPVPEW